MKKRSIIINIVGPENVGKNAFGATLTLLLQRSNESAQFIPRNSCLVHLFHEQSTDVYKTGLEQSKEHDFVIMNGGLSYCLLDECYERYKSTGGIQGKFDDALKDGLFYLTVVLRRKANQLDSLEGDMFVSEIKELLIQNGCYFMQCEYSEKSIKKLLNIVLFHHTFLNI